MQGQGEDSHYTERADAHARLASLFVSAFNALSFARHKLKKTLDAQESVFETYPHDSQQFKSAKFYVEKQLNELTWTRTFWAHQAVNKRESAGWDEDLQARFGIKPPMKYTPGRHLLSLSTNADGTHYDWKMDFQVTAAQEGGVEFPEVLDDANDAAEIMQQVRARLLKYLDFLRHRDDLKHRGAQPGQPRHRPRSLNALMTALGDVEQSLEKAIQGKDSMQCSDTSEGLGGRLAGWLGAGEEDASKARPRARRGGPEQDGDVQHNPDRRYSAVYDAPGGDVKVEVRQHFAMRRQWGFHMQLENQKTIDFINRMMPLLQRGWFEVVVTTGGNKAYHLQLTPWERPCTTYVQPFTMVADNSPMLSPGRNQDDAFEFRYTNLEEGIDPGEFLTEPSDPYLIYGKGGEIDGMVHALRAMRQLDEQTQARVVDFLRTLSPAEKGEDYLKYVRAYYSTDDSRASHLGGLGDRSIFFMNVQGVIFGVEMSSPSLPPSVNYLKHSRTPHVPRRGAHQAPGGGQQVAPYVPGWNPMPQAPQYFVPLPMPMPPPQQQQQQQDMSEVLRQLKSLHDKMKDMENKAPTAPPAQVVSELKKADAIVNDAAKIVTGVVQDMQTQPQPTRPPPPPQQQQQKRYNPPQRRQEITYSQRVAAPQPRQQPQDASQGQQGATEPDDDLPETGISVTGNEKGSVPVEIVASNLPDLEDKMGPAVQDVRFYLDKDLYNDNGAYCYTNDPLGIAIHQEALKVDGYSMHLYQWVITYIQTNKILEKQQQHKVLLSTADFEGDGKIYHDITISAGSQESVAHKDSFYSSNEMRNVYFEDGKQKYFKIKRDRIKDGQHPAALVRGRGRHRYHLQMYPEFGRAPYTDRNGRIPSEIHLSVKLTYNDRETQVQNQMTWDAKLACVDVQNPSFIGTHSSQGEQISLGVTKYWIEDQNKFVWGITVSRNGERHSFVAHKRYPPEKPGDLILMSDSMEDRTWAWIKKDKIEPVSLEVSVHAENRRDDAKRLPNYVKPGTPTAEEILEESSADTLLPMTYADTTNRYRGATKEQMDSTSRFVEDLRRQNKIAKFSLYLFGKAQMDSLNAALRAKAGGQKIITIEPFRVPYCVSMHETWLNGEKARRRAPDGDTTFGLVDLQGPVYMSHSGKFLIAPHVHAKEDGSDAAATWGLYMWDQYFGRYWLFAYKASGQHSYLINDPAHSGAALDNLWLFMGDWDGKQYSTDQIKSNTSNVMDIKVETIFRNDRVKRMFGIEQGYENNPYRLMQRHPDYCIAQSDAAEAESAEQRRLAGMAAILQANWLSGKRAQKIIKKQDTERYEKKEAEKKREEDEITEWANKVHDQFRELEDELRDTKKAMPFPDIPMKGLYELNYPKYRRLVQSWADKMRDYMAKHNKKPPEPIKPPEDPTEKFGGYKDGSGWDDDDEEEISLRPARPVPQQDPPPRQETVLPGFQRASGGVVDYDDDYRDPRQFYDTEGMDQMKRQRDYDARQQSDYTYYDDQRDTRMYREEAQRKEQSRRRHNEIVPPVQIAARVKSVEVLEPYIVDETPWGWIMDRLRMHWRATTASRPAPAQARPQPAEQRPSEEDRAASRARAQQAEADKQAKARDELMEIQRRAQAAAMEVERKRKEDEEARQREEETNAVSEDQTEEEIEQARAAAEQARQEAERAYRERQEAEEAERAGQVERLKNKHAAFNKEKEEIAQAGAQDLVKGNDVSMLRRTKVFPKSYTEMAMCFVMTYRGGAGNKVRGKRKSQLTEMFFELEDPYEKKYVCRECNLVIKPVLITDPNEEPEEIYAWRLFQDSVELATKNVSFNFLMSKDDATKSYGNTNKNQRTSTWRWKHPGVFDPTEDLSDLQDDQTVWYYPITLKPWEPLPELSFDLPDVGTLQDQSKTNSLQPCPARFFDDTVSSSINQSVWSINYLQKHFEKSFECPKVLKIQRPDTRAKPASLNTTVKQRDDSRFQFTLDARSAKPRWISSLFDVKDKEAYTCHYEVSQNGTQWELRLLSNGSDVLILQKQGRPRNSNGSEEERIGLVTTETINFLVFNKQDKKNEAIHKFYWELAIKNGQYNDLKYGQKAFLLQTLSLFASDVTGAMLQIGALDTSETNDDTNITGRGNLVYLQVLVDDDAGYAIREDLNTYAKGQEAAFKYIQSRALPDEETYMLRQCFDPAALLATEGKPVEQAPQAPQAQQAQQAQQAAQAAQRLPLQPRKMAPPPLRTFAAWSPGGALGRWQ